MEEAIAAYRAALEINPDYAAAHCNLGGILQRQGHFLEALASLRRGHELGSKRPDWRYPSEAWVSKCEQLVKLEARLPGPAEGRGQAERQRRSPRVGPDRLRHEAICGLRPVLGAGPLADDPKLGDDRKAGHRYNAACSAAAALSQGIDDPKPDDAARAKLRDQAKDWLRAELSAWEKVAMAAEPGNKPLVAKTLRHWKADADLAGVRDADDLAKLPETERAEWVKLWEEIDALLAKVAKP